MKLNRRDFIKANAAAAAISAAGLSAPTAAVAAGADGLIIEVHNDPPHALCDGPQSLTCEAFEVLAEKLRGVVSCIR